MNDLDTMIAQAQQRQAEREEAAKRKAADEAERIRQGLLDQLDRELRRAFPAAFLDALHYTLHTQNIYPQSYAAFEVRGVTLWLHTHTDRDVRIWAVRRPGKTERQNIGREFQQSGDDPSNTRLMDNLLCTIAEYAGDPGNPDEIPF